MAKQERAKVDPANPSTVQKFVDPLPVLEVLKPIGQREGSPLYQVTMRQVQQRLHRDFPPTTVWGYEGMFPGPTIEVRRGRPIFVRYLSALPTTPLLPVDPTVHGAESFRPAVRTVVHLHGGNTPAEYDGNPDAWFTPGITEGGPLFTTNLYRYPNRQQATALFYHDHAIGINRLNVYAGLTGFYLIRDKAEAELRLPSGPFEIPLVIQDRTFNADGSLFYPATIPPEFFGNTNLVNGKVWPYLKVEPRKYRFRILNGANARFYNLKLDPPLPMYQIGVDGGMLAKPVPRQEILLAPAERADVIIDFSGYAGNSFILTNSAPAPYPTGDPPDANTSLVMKFRVKLPLAGPDKSKLPKRLLPVESLQPHHACRTRDVTLNETVDDMGRPLVLLGIRGLSGRPEPLEWGDATTETPRLDTVELWRIINTTTDTHPIHLHLVRFQIIDRQPYDVDLLDRTGELRFTGPPMPPEENERGPKDTVRANPSQVTRIIARFGDFSGSYVWHCHMLEHEDHDMMRRLDVIRPGCGPT